MKFRQNRSSHNSNDQGLSGPLIKELTVHFNFEPVDPEFFITAFTHASYAHEQKIPSNERLEFLGDSVLALVVCEFLYRAFPDYSEGKLAKLKSTMVSAPVLASFCKQLNLERFIRLGQGELKTEGKHKLNILADLCEAFIGAYYLNFGLEATTRFLKPLIESVLPDIIEKSVSIDAKTNLQELTQSRGLKPEYRTIGETGPPHRRIFTVEVVIDNRSLGSGTGGTLKEAQNRAALEALTHLNNSGH